MSFNVSLNIIMERVILKDNWYEYYYIEETM